jgi:hypothetical protein
MALHEPFRHLHHKLWSKEGPESNWQFDSRPLKVGNQLDSGACRWSATHCWKLSRRVTTLVKTLSRSKFGARSYARPKSRESKLGQFWDSTLGVLGKRTIWMQVQQRAAENIIWRKVVASPEFGPWWVKWVQSSPWFVPTSKGCRMSFNQFVSWVLDVGPYNWVSLFLFLVYPGAFSMPLSPPLVLEAGSVPRVLEISQFE